MTEWRWDQGRILYFQYDVLKEIARTLVNYDGKDVNDDAVAGKLKDALKRATGLPFLPENYKVNRNYSRVFQCALLATTKGRGSLVVSDICRELATDNSIFATADDYLFEVARRFCFPFPAFQGYDPSAEAVYPFIAILKLLTARKLTGREVSLTLPEIAHYIIGNNCTGLEDIDHYKNLNSAPLDIDSDTIRQLREMVVFIGQLSYLKIFERKLFLDIADEEDAAALLNCINPTTIGSRLPDRVDEFISMTTMHKGIVIPTAVAKKNKIVSIADIPDREFAEGNKKRMHHLRIERSPMLRRLYIQLHPEPICNACKSNIKARYPWTDYMLDIHHLLPLSSVVRTLESGTSLSDMVGLCPSCHRAIHSYYSKWLYANSQDDFKNKKEAMEVYLEAINEIA